MNKTNEVTNNLEDKNEISDDMIEIKTEQLDESIQQDPLQSLSNSVGHTSKKDPLQILTNTMEHPIKKDPLQIGTNTMGHPNILPIDKNENLSKNVNKSQRKKSKHSLRRSTEHSIKKDQLQLLTNTMGHPINEDPLNIGTNTMGHPNILPLNESKNLSENMNKSQRKRKERNPGFLNAPAIKFHAFDPRPPEMRGISNAQKMLIDQAIDKNSRGKRKFGSVSGNQENIKGKHVIDEDPINVGTNSMGHTVTKPMRIIETENLSENMNVSQSIPDQIFEKGSLKKRKFSSISGNHQNIKGKNVTDKPITKPTRVIETENFSENMKIYQSIPEPIFDKGSLRQQKFGLISGNQRNIKKGNETVKESFKVRKNSMGHPVTKSMRMIETENLSENMNISESIPDQIKDSITVGTNSMGHPITGTVVIGIMGQSTECPKYKNKLCNYIEVPQGDIFLEHKIRFVLEHKIRFVLVLGQLVVLKKRIWG